MIFGIGELQRGIENDRRRIHELETALLKAEQERDRYKASLEHFFKVGDIVMIFDTSNKDNIGTIESIDEKGYALVDRGEGRYFLWSNFEGFKMLTKLHANENLN